MTDPTDAPRLGFDTLPLRPELLAGVERLGFTTMTDIQAAALPLALEGRDLIGHARTGSGKTAAFGLPLLHGLDLSDRSAQALVLCPTRELAQQVTGALRALAVGLPGTRIVTITGGAPMRVQKAALQAGAHVVVGTPGRVLNQLELGHLSLVSLQCLVLDEADRMLDMGFEEQVQAIVALAPEQRQTLLFSATWPDGMNALGAGLLHEPEVVGVQTLVDDDVLRQRAVLCDPDDRDSALADVLAAEPPTPTLVFCETRAQCQEVADFLHHHGAAVLALHGDLSQRDRDEVVVQLRNESARIVVATNVAARGLDLEGLGLVICYELSHDPDVHIHRVGRTARADAKGKAVSLVAGPHELHRLEAVEAHLGTPIPRETWTASGPPSLLPWTAPYRTLAIQGGRKDKLRAGDILGALTGEVGLPGTDVGKIELTDTRSWVAIRAEVAQQAGRVLDRTRIKTRRFRVTLLG